MAKQKRCSLQEETFLSVYCRFFINNGSFCSAHQLFAGRNINNVASIVGYYWTVDIYIVIEALTIKTLSIDLMERVFL